MKTSTRYLCVGASILAALAVVRAADEPKDGNEPHLRVLNPGNAHGPGPHVFMRRIGNGEKETVAYLGVITSPVSPTLTAQLGLPKGAGLVVNRVEPGTPAVSALQEHDILLKLDDQLLVESRQLSVLVRNHKQGDEITLTYIRGGKQATAKVKLAQHEVPKEMGLAEPWTPFGELKPAPGQANTFFYQRGNDREEVDRLLKVFPHHPDGTSYQIQIGRQQAPGFSATSVNGANSVLVYKDDDGALALKMEDGKKTLVAKNPKGEQVFSGPVSTADERKALPPDIAARLEKLEAMHHVSFRTDGDFQRAEVKIVEPKPQGILYRHPIAPPASSVF